MIKEMSSDFNNERNEYFCVYFERVYMWKNDLCSVYW